MRPFLALCFRTKLRRGCQNIKFAYNKAWENPFLISWLVQATQQLLSQHKPYLPRRYAWALWSIMGRTAVVCNWLSGKGPVHMSESWVVRGRMSWGSTQRSSWDGLKADYKFMHLSQLKAISNCIHLQVQFLYVTESHIVLLCLLGNNSPAHSAKWLADLIAPLCILTCLLFSLQSSDSPELSVPPVPPAPVGKADAGLPAPVPPTATSGLDDLDLLGKTLLQQSLPPESQQVRW